MEFKIKHDREQMMNKMKGEQQGEMQVEGTVMMMMMSISEEDPVPAITMKYFAESMKVCRRSVSDADIARYKQFATTLQQARGFGSDFNQAGDAGNLYE